MRVVVCEMSLAFGDTTVLNDVSLIVEPGSMVAIVGPSGVGKSSLLFAMSGLLPLKSGTVTFIRGNVAAHATPRLVAWVPQGNNALANRTVLDNAMLGALAAGLTVHDSRQAARVRLEQVGLAHLSGARPRTLSGGELQRLALARAAASGRPLLFADEPTGSLDGVNTGLITDMLRTLVGTGISIVVATHDERVAAACDFVCDLGAPERQP